MLHCVPMSAPEFYSSLISHYRKVDYELCGWGESKWLAHFGTRSKNPAAHPSDEWSVVDLQCPPNPRESWLMLWLCLADPQSPLMQFVWSSDIGFICQGAPATSDLNNFRVYFLWEVEGCPADSEGVAKGCAPAPGFENWVYVIDGCGFHYGADCKGTSVHSLTSPVSHYVYMY
jgi:hypothetical protein